MRSLRRLAPRSVSAEIHPLIIAIVVAAGCGGSPHEAPITAPIAITPDAGGHLKDPDLDRAPTPKLLAIDWPNVKLATDADALALWQQIAPTGEDWQQRLDEIPSASPIQHALAVALLRAGSFTCVAPVHACHAPLEIAETRPAATLTDPCLRRELALWAIDQLEPDDAPQLRDVVKQLAALPPPESQLVADAIRLASADPALTFELIAIAWKAGQHELVDGMMSALDEPHLIEAATKLHVDGAFEALTASTQRNVFLGALTDEQLDWKTRAQAMAELAGDDDKLAPDLVKALIAATRSPSCETAAAAAHVLDRHGERAYVPVKPVTSAPDKLTRGLCVTTAYEQQARSDERTPFTSFVPARGLELVTVTYDPYSDVDTDGDGDPHTNRTNELVDRSRVELPDLPDFLGSLRHCATKGLGTACSSEDHDFKLVWKNGLLARLEIVEKPPCQKP
ncbi:MAG: hypothetical protein ABJE66_37150 [Deltaproteobacteria bacterium]